MRGRRGGAPPRRARERLPRTRRAARGESLVRDRHAREEGQGRRRGRMLADGPAGRRTDRDQGPQSDGRGGTAYGSAIFAEFVPDVSDELVLRIEAAGMVSLGKTNTPRPLPFEAGVAMAYGRSRSSAATGGRRAPPGARDRPTHRRCRSCSRRRSWGGASRRSRRPVTTFRSFSPGSLRDWRPKPWRR